MVKKSTKKPSGKQTSTTAKKKSNKKKSTSNNSWFLPALKWMFVVGLWAFIALGAVVAWYASEIPEITSTPEFEQKFSVTVKDYEGNVITRYGELGAQAVSISDIPSELIYAVIAVEDRRFYQHGGVDPLGITRAFVTNLAKGRLAQGGSTITQQLAKNLFLSHEKTIKRKIQEALLAIWLEKELTKDEIITAYLNRVYFGSGAYGVKAAAKIYFKKDVKDLNIRECATIAGLLKAPSRYSPLNNPEKSRERTEVVLNAMQKGGFITEGTYENAKIETIEFTNKLKTAEDNNQRYFTDFVIDRLESIMGTPSGDIVVETTLNPNIQSNLYESIDHYMVDSIREEKKIGQAAAIVIRNDGAIVAMGGGLDYSTSQFNRATQSYRPPGSSFKPFVYIAAMEKGMRPDDTVSDDPITEGEYRPNNFADKYHGEVTLREALYKSLNAATFRVAEETGIGSVIEVARKLGIKAPLDYNMSLSLGSSGIPMIEMAEAYMNIARDGKKVEPYAITKIYNDDGTLYYQHTDEASKRVISRDTARYIKDILSDVISQGTGRNAQIDNIVAYGKTGTSQDFRDAWFVGFTDEYTCAVWLGNDDNSPMEHITGGSLPALIWKNIIRDTSEEYPVENKILHKNDSGFGVFLNSIISNSKSADRSTYNK